MLIVLRPVREDGTAAADLDPRAFIGQLAALVPSPKRHMTRYFGVLSSHASCRADVVPKPAPAITSAGKKPVRKSTYIPRAELLRRTFAVEVICKKCRRPFHLIALVKDETIAKKILTAMHVPCDVPELRPARSAPGEVVAARRPRPPPPDVEGSGGKEWRN